MLPEKIYFFIDQAMHIATIILITYLFSETQPVHFIIPVTLKGVIFVSSVLFCTKPANIFIKKYMEANAIIPDTNENRGLLNAGKIIGTLERILAFVLIIYNQFAAVGFIIAAKSVLRFRDAETAKTEYLLIGTLLSFGISILLGIVYCNFI